MGSGSDLKPIDSPLCTRQTGHRIKLFAHSQWSLALGRDQDQFTGLPFGFDLGRFVDFGVKVGEGTRYKIIGYGESPRIGSRRKSACKFPVIGVSEL
jgi:hypothetical protein